MAGVLSFTFTFVESGRGANRHGMDTFKPGACMGVGGHGLSVACMQIDHISTYHVCDWVDLILS